MDEDDGQLIAQSEDCLTSWSYIDENDGDIIDSNLERTFISAPITLTFDKAIELL